MTVFTSLLLAATVSVAGFCERAERREPLTVAFFGGSLTWGANATDPNITSWRGRICERLRKTYPNTPFRFVDAAIGGTGSELGIFRLDRDVIAHRPDLLIIEWSCNDGIDGANDNSSRSYEGIVRRYLAACPQGVVAQVIIPTKETIVREDESTLKRRTERLEFGRTYNLATSDLLGELRVRQRKGLLDLEAMWLSETGDTTHPLDPGYSLYADVIWEQLFAHPSAAVATVPEKSVFRDVYRHVVRRRLSDAKPLPDGWRNGVCSMRAGTFDFLCSRWQDGVTIATNSTPLKATFRGEVLLLFGESTEKSGKAEVWVDGRKIAAQDCSWFGKAFAPSAYLLWPLGAGFDGAKEHALEIRPDLQPGEELRIESICVAGEDAASVDFTN